MASSSALPWNWVIEALADLKQAGTSIIREAIASAPGFLKEGSDVLKERVALKYLEEHSDSAALPSSSGSDGRIDENLSAEEVLCRHLRKLTFEEVLYWHLRKAGTLCTAADKGNDDLYGRDLRNFIAQKKSKLPKSSLELLKELLIEGHSQFLSSLNEYSGLASCVEGIDPQTNGKYENVKNYGVNTMGEVEPIIQQSSRSVLDADNVVLQEDPSTSEQHVPEQNDMDGNGSDQFQKKVVSVHTENVQLLVHNSLPESPGNKNNSPQEVPLDSERNNPNPPLHEDVNFDCEQQVIAETPTYADGCGVTPDFDSNGDAFVIQKRGLNSQTSVGDDSMSCDWPEKNLCIKCDKGGQLLICSSSSCLISVHESCLGSIPNFDEKGLFYCPVCSYRRATILYNRAKKNVSQTRKALSAFIGRDLVEGNKKKTLAIDVPRETSQAAVAANLDDQYYAQFNKPETGNMRNTKAKQRGLTATVCSEADTAGGSCAPNRPLGAQESEISYNAEDRNAHDILNNPHDNSKLQQYQQTKAVNLANDGLVHQNIIVIPAVENGNANHIDKERDSMAEDFRMEDERQLAISNLPREEVDTSQSEENHVLRDGADEEDETILAGRNGEQAEHPSDQNLPSSPTSKGHAKRRKLDLGRSHATAGYQEKERVFYCNQKKNQSRPKRYSNPINPYVRRTSLRWTLEEEETLKVAVEKFARESEKNLPWSKILEFGSHIFHKTRQPHDLRDKWRNIKMREGSKAMER